MSIKKIDTETLRTMSGKDALILRGCGGDLQEWVDGINDMLSKENILRNGSRIEECSVFEYNGVTCLVFPFEGADLDIGKLAMWRLAMLEDYHGIWLSDFVDNYLGGFTEKEQITEKKKPDCPLIGQDGNVFNLIGIASRTLRRAGMSEQATEMSSRIETEAHNYNEALCIIMEYVNVTSVDDDPEEELVLGVQ
ncbi:MAG: hypothetical protein IJ711_04565 [Lachnospiraceae bacterium]|nr:hypothetical protein [Lachnospiraceae bacterium]